MEKNDIENIESQQEDNQIGKYTKEDIEFFNNLAVAAGVRLIFGLYPARQAAKKSPIEALRYE